MGSRSRRRWWAFDRPLLGDGLFWSGLALGLVLAFYGTSSPFTQQSVVAQVMRFVGQILAGVLLVGVVGGAVRNFVRGYRGDRTQEPDPEAGSRS